jgi:uncharacterized lipoprotein
MKRIKYLLLIFLMMMLIGCKNSNFNWDKAVTTLQNNGYIIVSQDETQEDFEKGNSQWRSEIRSYGYPLFDFNITGCISFSTGNKNEVNISLIKFENHTQAQSMYQYEHYIRSETNYWRQQVIDNVLIMSIDENANKLLHLNVD